MVFRDTKKRRAGPKAPISNSTTIITKITDLPEEILLNILDYGLSTLDVLRARLSNSLLTAACSTYLSDKLTRIYIHPSPGSLRRVHDICDHPVLAKGVTEVVLLGHMDWHFIERAWPNYRTGRLPDDNAVDYDAEGQGRDPNTVVREWEEAGDEWRCRFRGWPMVYPTAVQKAERAASPRLGRVETKSSLVTRVNKAGLGFGDAYAPLLRALVKLPKLCKISFAETVEGRPGWNQIRQDTMRSFAKGQATAPTRNAYARNTFSRALQPAVSSRADAEVLMSLLTSTALSVLTHLALGTELPFVAQFLPFSSELSARLTGLESIELLLDAHWSVAGGTRYQRFCRSLLAAATNLQHLKLLYRANKSVLDAREDSSLAFLLPDPKDWPWLKTFTLINSDPITQTLFPRKRNPRPLALVFDFPAFIAAHSGTLERMKLGNVLFLAPAEPPPYANINGHSYRPYDFVATTLHTSLSTLRTCERLTRVEWEVNNFEHHECCHWHQDHVGGLRCDSRLDCGIVWHDRLRGFTDGMFGLEGLAGELGCSLVCSDGIPGGAWDFGAGVEVEDQGEEGVEGM